MTSHEPPPPPSSDPFGADAEAPADCPAPQEPIRRVSVLKSGEVHDHRTRPCAQCPWRTDADLRLFSDADMEMLKRANGQSGREAPLDAPTVACHLDQPGTRHEFRWCAGWLAVVGHDHLAVRVAVMREALPLAAVEPGADWPELHPSLDALLAARDAQNGQCG